jgi:hypothetical protein
MPFKPVITTSNFPRPLRVPIPIEGTNQTAADFQSSDRSGWLLANDIRSISDSIAQPATRKVATTVKDYFMAASDEVIKADASAKPLRITLPDATQVQGQTKTVKKWNTSTNNVTVAAIGGQTIDNSPTMVLTGSARPSFDFLANGGNWLVV